MTERLLAEVEKGGDLGSLLAAIHVVLRLGEEGLQFFTLSAGRMRNPRGRAIFHILARDERAQLAVLRERIESLRARLGDTAAGVALGLVPERQGTENPIFSHGRELTDRNAAEIEVLKLAVAVKWDAHEFLLGRAASARDAGAQLVYLELAGDELLRYEHLVQAYEAVLGLMRWRS